MDAFMKLSREAQIVLGGAVLYVILSFFHWQASGPFGVSEWHGFGGTVTALIGIALLVWEIGRLIDYKISLGSLTPGLVSLALALLLLIMTVITFLSHNEIRAWPAWVGLLLSIVIFAAAVKRGKGEGVALGDIQKQVSTMASSAASKSGSSSKPPASSSSEAPPASEPPAEA
jgi:hypothetical protein